MRACGRLLVLGLIALWSAALPLGAAIDTEWLEQSWPRERRHTYEVDKYPVQWRQAIDRTHGLLGGIRFTSPLDAQQTWDLAQDYHDVGQHTPGVEAVRFIEEAPGRQVIELDVTVLWRKITLRFAVEREAPRRLRFELLDNPFGAYYGYATFTPSAEGTAVDLATCLKPARRAPARLLLAVERLALLGGARAFFASCEQRAEKNRDRHH